MSIIKLKKITTDKNHNIRNNEHEEKWSELNEQNNDSDSVYYTIYLDSVHYTIYLDSVYYTIYSV